MIGQLLGTALLGESIAAPATLRVTIGGALRTSLVRNPGGWSVSHARRQRSTARVELGFAATAPLRIRSGEELELWRGDERFFAGTIRSMRQSYPDSAGFIQIVSLEAVDFSELADRRVISERYTGKFIGVAQTTGDVVRAIVSEYLSGYGVSDAGVADGGAFDSFSFYLITVAEALDRIATATGFVWWIDDARVLHFQAPEDLDAPMEIGPTARDYLSLSVEESSEELRNIQYVRGGVDRGASRTEAFHGDGQTRTFTLARDVAGGQNSGGTEPLIRVNSSTQSVGIRGLEPDDDPGSSEWFFEPHGNRITQNRSLTPLSSSDLLEVTYDPEIPVLVVSRSDAAIAQRAAIEGTSGIYERVDEDDQVEDSIGAVNLASALIEAHSVVPRILDLETAVLGWRVGDILRLNLAATHAISGEFRVSALEIRDGGGDRVLTRVRAVDGEPLGGWIEFFRRLARRIRFPSIDSGDVQHLVGLSLDELDLADVVASALGDSLIDPATDLYSMAQLDVEIGAEYLIGSTIHRVGADVGDFER